MESWAAPAAEGCWAALPSRSACSLWVFLLFSKYWAFIETVSKLHTAFSLPGAQKASHTSRLCRSCDAQRPLLEDRWSKGHTGQAAASLLHPGTWAGQALVPSRGGRAGFRRSLLWPPVHWAVHHWPALSRERDKTENSLRWEKGREKEKERIGLASVFGLQLDETPTDSTKQIPYSPLLPKWTDTIPPSLALWKSYPCFWLTLLTLMLSSATYCGRGQSARRDPKSSSMRQAEIPSPRPRGGLTAPVAGLRGRDAVCLVCWETGPSGDFPWQSSGQYSARPLQSGQLRSLVWEQRSHSKKEKDRKRERERSPAWLSSVTRLCDSPPGPRAPHVQRTITGLSLQPRLLQALRI